MKKLIFNIVLGIKSVLRLIFSLMSGGSGCLVCGTHTQFSIVCPQCVKKHFDIDFVFDVPRCRICGKPLICEKEICSVCREEPVIKALDLMLPLFPYKLWNKELMFLWKTQEVRQLSGFFAGLIARVLKKLDARIIVPVPPRKGKIKEKGWDQIDELCSLLEYKYGYRVLKLLERHTKVQQKKLDREGRLQQIGKAYFCVPEPVLQKRLQPYGGFPPESVVLLDDVCTTGSTLESCAQILKEVGIKKITGITLFSVD